MISDFFYKITEILDLYQTTQCTNGKVLEFQTLCTSFYIEVGNTRNNRVPIDNIRASGSRPQAKGRCLLSEC